MSVRTCLFLPVLWASLACSPPSAAVKPAPSPADPASPPPSPAASAAEDAAEARRLAELAHHVVSADRITYSYLLLLSGPDAAKPPTHTDLDKLVQEAFPNNLEDEEVSLLRGLLREPTADDEAAEGRRASDLLALEIDVFPRTPPSGPQLIEEKVLTDPDLTRDLTPVERDSLPARTSLLVLRAAYRNQHGVRGLRLLQTLVRVVATRRGALIHDPDTLETVGPTVFSERRLQTSLGNIADQVPVIPFPDPARAGMLRLATRGMRRFGSVDIELAGLPGDLTALQRATFFIHGLARVLIEQGEYDRTGFAVELPEILPVHHSDCASAYAGRPGSLPRCKDCPDFVEIHLVERAPEPHDAVGHVVARIVAPRPVSDAPTYDQPAWAQQALARLFGP